MKQRKLVGIRLSIEEIKKLEEIRDKEYLENNSQTIRMIIKRYWETIFK